MCFILILVYALHEFTRANNENAEIKEKAKLVDSSRESAKLINVEFKKLVDELNKEKNVCRDVRFEVPDENLTAIRVVFVGNDAWFKENDSHLNTAAQNCIQSFAPKFLEKTYDLDKNVLKGKKHISQITVEGHTNSKARIGYGDAFLGNLDLSQQRALETVKFIIQNVKALDHDAKFKAWREKVLAANGRSYAEKIFLKDSKGKDTPYENYEASKRVEFKATLNYGF